MHPYFIEFVTLQDIPVRRFERGFGVVRNDGFRAIYSDTAIAYFQSCQRYDLAHAAAEYLENRGDLFVIDMRP